MLDAEDSCAIGNCLLGHIGRSGANENIFEPSNTHQSALNCPERSQHVIVLVLAEPVRPLLFDGPDHGEWDVLDTYRLPDRIAVLAKQIHPDGLTKQTYFPASTSIGVGEHRTLIDMIIANRENLGSSPGDASKPIRIAGH